MLAQLVVAVLLLQASLHNPNVPTGEGDAIFVVGEGGYLEPIAVRTHGAFMKPGSNEGGPSDRLRMESNASIAVHGNRVHVVFGGRTVATVAAKVENGAATIAIPPALHLNDNVNALASPTLGGHAAHARRAPTAAERTAALAAAAKSAGVAPSRFTVRNLTALDLGRGIAFAGTVNVRGTGSPRKDRRIFFIAEPGAGRAPKTTLFETQTVTVTEPLLEYVGEHLVDAIDLGDGTLSVVTRQIGYDAHTYRIFSRRGAGWKEVYTGGGAAM